MGKFLESIKGKKTYITMGVMFICGGLSAIGVSIPEYVYVMLAALGITFVRAGVTPKVAP